MYIYDGSRGLRRFVLARAFMPRTLITQISHASTGLKHDRVDLLEIVIDRNPSL